MTFSNKSVRFSGSYATPIFGLVGLVDIFTREPNGDIFFSVTPMTTRSIVSLISFRPGQVNKCFLFREEMGD
jgi:hypothetical protein